MTIVVWARLPDPRAPEHAGRARVAPCAIPGCPDLVYRWRLCRHHRHRYTMDRPLVMPHDAVGERPSGHGVYGVVWRDEDAVMCHECGRWLRVITHGHLASHGLTRDEYRVRHGLSKAVPLCCLGYSRTRGDLTRARPEFIEAATARLRVHQPEAVVAAAAATVSDAGRASRARGLRATATSAARRCAECGLALPTGPEWRRTTTCSTACRDASKGRAARRRSADRYGEPYDGEWGTGTGSRMTVEAVAAWHGVAPASVLRRVEAGTMPHWDGRTDGYPWWWESTITTQERGPRRGRRP